MDQSKDYWFTGNRHSTTLVKILRWTARIWSLFAFALALVIAISPDPYATEKVPLKDLLILSLWGIAILGLVLAWRWERPGAWLAIITLTLRELIFILINREWHVNFLLIWALIIPPAIMYLLAAHLDTKEP